MNLGGERLKGHFCSLFFGAVSGISAFWAVVRSLCHFCVQGTMMGSLYFRIFARKRVEWRSEAMCKVF